MNIFPILAQIDTMDPVNLVPGKGTFKFDETLIIIGAVLGAIQAGSHVGLLLHREWCEATIPHDHKH